MGDVAALLERRELKLGRLPGRVAIVTGASDGIGQGMAWRVRGRNATVLVADLAQ